MKVCRDCNVEKPLSEFYVHKAMLDGHLNKCIECVKKRVSKHREANLEKVQEYDRKRGSFPHRVKARKEYAKTENGKIAHKKARETYKKRYPMKYSAKVICGNAIKNGKLIRPHNCSECGSTERIEGHHDDYTKPLSVRWLCKKCHTNWHKVNTPIYE